MDISLFSEMQKECEILMLPGTRMVVNKIEGLEEDRCEVHVSTLWPQVVLPVQGPVLTPIVKRRKSARKSEKTSPDSLGRSASLHVRKQFVSQESDEGLGKTVQIFRSKSTPTLSIDTSRKESNASQPSIYSSNASLNSSSSSFTLSGSLSSLKGLFAKRDSTSKKKPPTPIPVNLSPNLKKESRASFFTFDAITEAADELREASEMNLWQLIDVAHPGWDGEIEDLTYLANVDHEDDQGGGSGGEDEHKNEDLMNGAQRSRHGAQRSRHGAQRSRHGAQRSRHGPQRSRHK